MERELKYGEITGDILKCAFKAFKILGGGFLEKVYESAFMMELEALGHEVECQYEIDVVYCGKVIGRYYADLTVDQKVIIELKTADKIETSHHAQLVHYLKATGYEVGMLLAIGSDKIRFQRVVN